MIIWPVVVLEEWNIERRMARMVISPPQGEPMLPDHPNWSWHEYGMRVGFWRVLAMFERLGIKPTLNLNARVCEVYPVVAGAALEAGWEFTAHSYDQQPMHVLENQLETIERSLDIIHRFSGERPRGWLSPGLTQTYDTLDHLAELGVDYIGDWAVDDEPVMLKTRRRPVVALPYNFEVHDIVMMNLQNHASSEFLTRAMDQFDVLYEESESRPKVMALAFHPYLSGAAHRIKYVERAFEHILSHEGVAVWSGSAITDWFKAQPVDVKGRR